MTAPDDAEDPIRAGVAAWLAAQWAARGTERPPRCAICGAIAVLDASARWTITHDPVAHGLTPPDPTVREPNPDALAAVRRAMGERDDD